MTIVFRKRPLCNEVIRSLMQRLWPRRVYKLVFFLLQGWCVASGNSVTKTLRRSSTFSLTKEAQRQGGHTDMALKVLINKLLSSRVSNRHFICIIIGVANRCGLSCITQYLPWRRKQRKLALRNTERYLLLAKSKKKLFSDISFYLHFNLNTAVLLTIGNIGRIK